MTAYLHKVVFVVDRTHPDVYITQDNFIAKICGNNKFMFKLRYGRCLVSPVRFLFVERCHQRLTHTIILPLIIYKHALTMSDQSLLEPNPMESTSKPSKFHLLGYADSLKKH